MKVTSLENKSCVKIHNCNDGDIVIYEGYIHIVTDEYDDDKDRLLVKLDDGYVNHANRYAVVVSLNATEIIIK